MNWMYVSVVATRKATKTRMQTLHCVPIPDGPERAIQNLAGYAARLVGHEWDLNIMQITQHEFDMFSKRLNLEVEA